MPERPPQPVSDPGMRYVLQTMRRSFLAVVAAIDAVTKEPDPPRPLRKEDREAA